MTHRTTGPRQRRSRKSRRLAQPAATARFAGAALCLALFGPGVVGCGDSESDSDPARCPADVTESLVACVEAAFDAAGTDAGSLPLQETMDACIASEPRDLTGVTVSCTLRLDLEVNAPVEWVSVAAPPAVDAATASVANSCAASGCLVPASHFDVRFGRRPRALRLGVAIDEALSLLPAPQTWTVIRQTALGAPLGQAQVAAAFTSAGGTGAALAEAMFSVNAIEAPIGVLFQRRVQRGRVLWDQRAALVFVPRGETDFVQLVEIDSPMTVR